MVSSDETGSEAAYCPEVIPRGLGAEGGSDDVESGPENCPEVIPRGLGAEVGVVASARAADNRDNKKFPRI